MVQSNHTYRFLLQSQGRVQVEEVEMELDEQEEVKVNIFMCVSVKISQNHRFSLFFSHNWPEKCNTCVLLLFSERQILAAQVKKWREARHSTTCLTLNPQWAKSFRSGTLALHQIKYFQHMQAIMLLMRKLPFSKIGT